MHGVQKNVNVTDIKIYPVADSDPLLAFVRIIIDDCFLVRDIKVIQGKKGLFVAMPSLKGRNGSFRDVVHPIDQTTRLWMEEMILDAYTGSRHLTTGPDDTYG